MTAGALREPDAFLSVRAVAKQAGVHEKTVRRAIASGDLTAFYIGTAVRISPESARAWITARPVVRVSGSPRARRVVRREVRGGLADLRALDRSLR